MGMGGSVGMSMGAPRGTALTLVASSGMEVCAVSSVLHDRLSVDRFESESSCSESECSPNPPASMDKSSKDISHASREAACMPLPLPLPCWRATLWDARRAARRSFVTSAKASSSPSSGSPMPNSGAPLPLPLPLPLPSRPRLIAAAAPPSMAVLEWRRLMPVPCIGPARQFAGDAAPRVAVDLLQGHELGVLLRGPRLLADARREVVFVPLAALLARAAWDQLGDAHPLRRPALDGLGVARDELAQVVVLGARPLAAALDDGGARRALLGGPRVVQRLGGVLEVAAAAHDGVAQLHVLVGRPVDAVGGGIHRWAVARETDGGLPANVRRRLRAVSS